MFASSLLKSSPVKNQDTRDYGTIGEVLSPEPTESGTRSYVRHSSFSLLPTVIVVAVLYLAREFIVPLAVALLLSFLLAPIVGRLERIKLSKIFAVLSSVLISILFLGLLAWTVATQLIDVSYKLPEYSHNIHEKLQSLNGPIGSAFNRITSTLEKFKADVVATPSKSAVSKSREVDQAIPVEVVDDSLTPLGLVRDVLGPILHPFLTAGMIILFAIFILISWDDLRNRLIRLIGHGHLTRTTQAFDEAANRVGRYLLAQCLINLVFGVGVGLGLWAIGLPNPALWGLLGGVLRFIPFIGPWIAAVCPTLLALAVFPAWSQALLVVALFLVLELSVNSILEPFFYGASTGLSPIAILVSAVFWTWLWGGAGLFMSTPLTVCLVVLGRFAPRLEFLYILLGDDPVLTPAVRVYQRLLAGDFDAAEAIAELFLKENSLEALFDQVLVPALVMAEQDSVLHHIDLDTRSFIRQNLRHLINDLSLSRDLEVKDESVVDQQIVASAPTLICLPARDEADDLYATVCNNVLLAHGYETKTIAYRTLFIEASEQIKQLKIKTVFLCAVPPYSINHAAYAIKRLRSHFPDLAITVSLWGTKNPDPSIAVRLKDAGATKIVGSVEESLQAARESA